MWHIAKSLQDAAIYNAEMQPEDEASSYFISKIFEPTQNLFNYNSNPFTETLFNEPTSPYGKKIVY
jgi:hypothetical protein